MAAIELALDEILFTVTADATDCTAQGVETSFVPESYSGITGDQVVVFEETIGLPADFPGDAAFSCVVEFRINDELIGIQTANNEPPGGGTEGLTPGFWKNNASKWDASQWNVYVPDQPLSSVFDVSSELTFLDALNRGGGGENALFRHAVAALLNAAHPDVDYPLSSSQIITAVNAAVASGDAEVIESLKDELDEFNNFGADLSMRG